MTEKVSRRALLNAGCRNAAAFGVVAAASSVIQVSSSRAQNTSSSTNGSDAPSGALVTLAPGLRVHYKEDYFGAPWLKPEPMLFLHGGGEIGDVWWGWIPRMGQQFRLLRPDLPGFGFSTIPASFEWSLTNFATVIADFLDKLGVSSAHIVGAKTGGAIAVQFAASYPRMVKTLVLASGPFTPLDPKFGNSPQKVRLGSAATEDEIAYFNRLKRATPPETHAGIDKLLAGISFDGVLPKIQAPTLVITSDHSALQTVESVLQHQRKIPNSRLLVLTSDAYHVAVANAEECATNVLEFIQKTQRVG